MMDDLVQWLRAQLDEDERIAREAARQRGGGDWEAEADPEDRVAVVGRYRSEEPGYPNRPVVVDTDDNETAFHIARHSPARVLREIDAKRDLLRFAEGIHDHHETFTTGVAARLEETLRLFALAYEDRLGFQESWRP